LFDLELFGRRRTVAYEQVDSLISRSEKEDAFSEWRVDAFDVRLRMNELVAGQI
jgi:hypothetical protein